MKAWVDQITTLTGESSLRDSGFQFGDWLDPAGPADRIGTGFVGTPLIRDALTTAGEVDTAYELLMQTRSLSWLYPATVGATTIWERFDFNSRFYADDDLMVGRRPAGVVCPVRRRRRDDRRW